MIKEWESEPNRVEFKHAGLDCLINRNHSGAWCGYVAVPKGHPWFEKTYSDLYQLGIAPAVHGGLTYSEHCQGQICHKTESEDEAWWLGFDCNHAFDFAPGVSNAFRQFSDLFDGMTGHQVYRNILYVTAETQKLAEQIAELEKG